MKGPNEVVKYDQVPLSVTTQDLFGPAGGYMAKVMACNSFLNIRKVT